MYYYLITKKDGTLWYKEATEEEYSETDTRKRVTVEEYQQREPEKERQIAKYKKMLNDTDYIACKLAEGVCDRSEYETVLAKRSVWREQINEIADGYPFAEELL